MAVFSYSFFILWAVSALIFYTAARKYQWETLLAASLVFYILSMGKLPVILIAVFFLTYAGAIILNILREKGCPDKFLKFFRRGIIVSCVALLVLGRTAHLFSVLGNSYFTLKAIGYLIDSDRDPKKCERNFGRYLLYLIYFPTIVQGPFNRYTQFRDCFKDVIRFDYTRLMHGLQRFLWGAFKKLIVAERLALFVNYVYGDLEQFNGLIIVMATCAYAIQLYADFSGYMDIMIGVSDSLGISIPENFRQPYFSKSLAEFWRRWHITLGHWFRDYVMFSFVMSSTGRKVGKWFKKISKKAGKKAATVIGTAIVWFLIGLWHNLSVNYFAWGMYNCVIICFSMMFEDHFSDMRRKLRVDGNGVGYQFFCVVRTICLVLISDVLLIVHSFGDINLVAQKILTDFWPKSGLDIAAVGWSFQDVKVLCIGICIMFIVSVMKEKEISLLHKIDRMPLPLRWGVYYLLLFSVLIYGCYGGQYDASQFIYMQF